MKSYLVAAAVLAASFGPAHAGCSVNNLNGYWSISAGLFGGFGGSILMVNGEFNLGGDRFVVSTMPGSCLGSGIYTEVGVGDKPIKVISEASVKGTTRKPQMLLIAVETAASEWGQHIMLTRD